MTSTVSTASSAPKVAVFFLNVQNGEIHVRLPRELGDHHRLSGARDRIHTPHFAHRLDVTFQATGIPFLHLPKGNTGGTQIDRNDGRRQVGQQIRAQPIDGDPTEQQDRQSGHSDRRRIAYGKSRKRHGSGCGRRVREPACPSHGHGFVNAGFQNCW